MSRRRSELSRLELARPGTMLAKIARDMRLYGQSPPPWIDVAAVLAKENAKALCDREVSE